MKKGAVKFSGLLTMIISLILFVCMALILLLLFEVLPLPESISQYIYLAYAITVGPLLLVFTEYLSVNLNLLPNIITIVFALFTLFMTIWGIKEMTLSKKSDEDFAKCKKTCAFVMVLKFLFFFYNFAVLVMSFVLPEIKLVFEIYNAFIGVQYLCQIVICAIMIITFICFIVPVLKFREASKLIKSGAIEQNNNYGTDLPAQQTIPDGTVYQAPYYNVVQNEPLRPGEVLGTEQPLGENAIIIVPGQNGVPQNITQKGINDLIRLERLRQNGTLDEENYNVMKQKICATNVAK